MKKVLALVVTCAFLLTGCYKLEATFTFNADETVDATMVVGVKEDAYNAIKEMGGEEGSDPFDDAIDEGPLSGADVTTSDWNEDGYVGKKMTASGISLEAFGSDENSVEVKNGEYHVTLDVGDAAADEEAMSMLALASPPVIAFSFEFPGDVVKADGGTIDGNKVTYRYDTTEALKEMPKQLEIVAKAEAGSSSTAALVVGGIVLLLVIAAGAVLTLRKRANA